jgi:hypothetical protein
MFCEISSRRSVVVALVCSTGLSEPHPASARDEAMSVTRIAKTAPFATWKIVQRAANWFEPRFAARSNGNRAHA